MYTNSKILLYEIESIILQTFTFNSKFRINVIHMNIIIPINSRKIKAIGNSHVKNMKMDVCDKQ